MVQSALKTHLYIVETGGSRKHPNLRPSQLGIPKCIRESMLRASEKRAMFRPYSCCSKLRHCRPIDCKFHADIASQKTCWAGARAGRAKSVYLCVGTHTASVLRNPQSIIVQATTHPTTTTTPAVGADSRRNDHIAHAHAKTRHDVELRQLVSQKRREGCEAERAHLSAGNGACR